MKTSCLITGVDGFSGGHVYKHLKKNNKNECFAISKKKQRKNIFKWDLTNGSQKTVSKIQKVDWIIHIASIHKPADFEKKPKIKKEKNIRMVKNLLNFAKKKKIENIIFFSTIDISYKNIFTKKKFYNLSKLNSEKILTKAYKQKYLKKLLILRIPAIVGKNAHTNFVTTLIESLKKNKKIEIFQHNYFNNVVHVDDLSKLIFRIINYKKFKNDRFMYNINCLSSRGMSTNKIISFLKKKINTKSIILVKKKNSHANYLKTKRNAFNFNFMQVRKVLGKCINNK